MSESKEYLIDQMCGSEDLKHTLEFRGGMTTTNGHVILEGHDISHLVTNINIEASANDMIRVHLELGKIILK